MKYSIKNFRQDFPDDKTCILIQSKAFGLSLKKIDLVASFKILYPYSLEKELKKEGRPLRRAVPWDLIKDHESQAQRNH